jgi:hypothetical protein
MTLGCDFDITQLVDNNLGYHVCCYKVHMASACAMACSTYSTSSMR